MSEPTIIHSENMTWEAWEDTHLETRGRVFWKTLFSCGLTDTDSLTTGIAVVHPGDALHPHSHTPSEIYFVMQGEGVVTLGDAEHIARAGDAVFIPGDTRHGIANKSESDVIFLYAFARDSFDTVVYRFPNEM